MLITHKTSHLYTKGIKAADKPMIQKQERKLPPPRLQQRIDIQCITYTAYERHV